MSLAAGAAMCPASSGASGFGARFVEAVVEDGLGMRRGPAVRQHLLQAQIVRMQAEQKVADVSPRLDAMTLRTGQDRVQHGRPRPRRFAAQEEPILSANGLVPKGPLAHVVVDRQTTIFGVATQRLPLVSCVGDRLGQAALGQRLAANCAK